ncbi:MAG: DUF4235 domain-containing protein [Nocardioidaceae bacterium]
MAKKDKTSAKKKAKGKRSWKLLGTGSALIAGIATTKALDATWRTATGHRPPTKAESPDIADREALIWAAVSGMAIGVAKTYATRRAASYWVKSTGALPPGMDDEAGIGKSKLRMIGR